MCPAYKVKDCPGCLQLDECRIVECAKSKGIRYCFSCKEFPCRLFEEGFDWDISGEPLVWKPYGDAYIKFFKKNREKFKKS